MAINDFGNRKAVSVIYNGAEIIGGGDDLFFTITLPDNLSVTKPGINNPYVQLNSDTTAKIVINVLPNSIANRTFWNTYSNQVGALGGLQSITLIDEVGRTYECKGCSLESPSEVSAGAADSSDRVWGFGVSIYKAPED